MSRELQESIHERNQRRAKFDPWLTVAGIAYATASIGWFVYLCKLSLS